MDDWKEKLKKIGKSEQQQEQERKRSYKVQEDLQRQQKVAVDKWYKEQLDPAFTELETELKEAGIKTQRRQGTGPLVPLTRPSWSLVAAGFEYTVTLDRGGKDVTGHLHFTLPGVLKMVPVLPPEDSDALPGGMTRVLDWTKTEIKEDFQRRFVTWHDEQQKASR